MQSILVQVGATLVVGVILIQLAQSDDLKTTRTTKTSPLKRPAGDQTKEARSQQAKLASARLAEQRRPATKLAPRPRKSSVARNETKTKFQSRVMRSANPIEPLGDSPLGSDAWSQHSLLPTFVDQEQGDEMVALASDETSPQVKVAARLSGPLSNLSDLSYMKRYQADRLQREQIEDERYLAAREHQEQNKPRSSSLVADDYYADDDDDSDSEQEHGAQLVKVDQKPSRHARDEPSGGANEQRIADFRPIEQSSSVKQAEIKNVTGGGGGEQVVNLQRSANGWLPTGTTQIKQQTQLDQSRPLANPMGRGEKQAGLFGGHGEAPTFGNSLSKTDMAIEYLRSILKTKQSRLQSSQMSANSSQQQQQQMNEDLAKFDKGLKTYYPLPVHLRDFAQPANRSTASDQAKLTASGGDLQEVPGRFSINDVKQQANQGIASTAVPFVPITSISPGADSSSKQTSGAETKPTAEPKVSSPPSQLGFGPANPAEGASSGRDYSESHDDIPHGLNLIKQQIQQQAGKPADGTQQKAAEKTAESMAAFASDQLHVALTGQHDDKFRFHSQQPQALVPPSHLSAYFDMRKSAETRPTQSEFKGEEFPQQVANIAPDFTKLTNQIPAGTQQNFDFDQANLDENLFKQEQQVVQTIPQQEIRIQKPIELGQTKSGPKPLEVAPAQAPIEQAVEPEPRIVEEVANLERGQVKIVPVKLPARHQMISSKLYRNEQPPHFYEPQHQAPSLYSVPNQPHNYNQYHHSNQNHPRQPPVEYGGPNQPMHHHQPQQAPAPQHNQQQAYQQYFAPQPSRPSYQAPVYQQEHLGGSGGGEHRQAKAPRIVSYNYFDGNEQNQPTNFQLGDSLLSSTGDIEHTLSNSELDAIQHQFMTAEHPVVPIAAERPHNADKHHHHHHHHQDPAHRELSRLLAGLKSSEASYKSVEPLKELASEEQQASASELKQAAEKRPDRQPEKQLGEPKRKSLVVYLNHPRGDEMSRSAAASGESLGQLISEQTSGDPFVAAREFDSHGLAKDSTRLDVASLQGLGGALPKEALGDKDKDGLSVVVIGDAYKYKKIVLLISAKTGGLKFVPMVKDMRRR